MQKVALRNDSITNSATQLSNFAALSPFASCIVLTRGSTGKRIAHLPLSDFKQTNTKSFLRNDQGPSKAFRLYLCVIFLTSYFFLITNS